jgi:hypothetical protein
MESWFERVKVLCQLSDDQIALSILCGLLHILPSPQPAFEPFIPSQMKHLSFNIRIRFIQIVDSDVMYTERRRLSLEMRDIDYHQANMLARLD